MRLYEIFDTKADISLEYQNNKIREYEMRIGEERFEVSLIKHDDGSRCDFVFARLVRDEDGSAEFTTDLSPGAFNNAAKIFAGLKDIIMSDPFVADTPALTFASKHGENSRIKTYKALGAKLAQAMGRPFNTVKTDTEVIFVVGELDAD